MGDNKIKLVSILCAILMVATVFSAAVTNVVADDDEKEKPIESLNPDVATDEYTHVVWQENLTGNFEIYYTNNATRYYENTLMQAIEVLEGLDDKDSK